MKQCLPQSMRARDARAREQSPDRQHPHGPAAKPIMQDRRSDPFALDDAAPALPSSQEMRNRRDLASLKAASDQRDIDRNRDARQLTQQRENDAPFGPPTGDKAEVSGRSLVGSISPPNAAEGAPTRWTPAMRRVYVALTSATWRGRPQRELARLAKVSERRFRELRQHPAIVEMLNAETVGSLRDQSIALADAIVSNMRLPGRDGVRDRELMATMIGIMPSTRVDHRVNGKVQHEHSVGGALAAAIERARAARRAASNPQDVENRTPVIDVTPAT